MIIKIIKNIKKIINEFIEKPSIIILLVNIYSLFLKKEEEIKYIENEDDIKVIVECNHCNNIIESEMYCYKDNLYCSERCRSNYYE